MRFLYRTVKTMSQKTPQNIRRENIASSKFVRLDTIVWTDGEKERKWDCASRTTRQPGSDADAVAILARLQSKINAPSTLLVLQYRPPMGAKTVEFPAGLIDPGETPEQAAVRELKEETGFHGRAVSVSPATCPTPGLTDETIKIVTVDVDLDDPGNQNPLQELDEGESIEVRRVPMSDLLKELDKLASAGYYVFNGLYSLALGLSMNTD